MDLTMFLSASLIVFSVLVLATQKSRWIQLLSIAELLLSVLLILIYAGLVSLPGKSTTAYIIFIALAAWIPLMIFNGRKWAAMVSAMACWSSTILFLLEIGWLSLDRLRHLF